MKAIFFLLLALLPVLSFSQTPDSVAMDTVTGIIVYSVDGGVMLDSGYQIDSIDYFREKEMYLIENGENLELRTKYVWRRSCYCRSRTYKRLNGTPVEIDHLLKFVPE